MFSGCGPAACARVLAAVARRAPSFGFSGTVFMPSLLPLFRPAALRARSTPLCGRIVLVRPLSFSVLTAIGAGIACAIVMFLIWGRYTEHSTLRGRLMPDLGVLKIRAPRYGVIVEKRVAEGDRVSRGDVLYVVSGEHSSTGIGSTLSSIAQTLTERRLRVEEQISEAGVVAKTERSAMLTTLAMLKEEERQLSAGEADQRSRVRLAEQAVARYAKMQAEGFVSREQWLARRRDLLDQRGRLEGLQRDRTQVRERIADVEHQAAELPVKTRSRIADLKRDLARIRAESIDNEAQRRVSILAPADGVITAVLGEVGQTVDNSRVLASILPKGARLRAELEAPSRAVGFIEVGDRVLLRYQAYPYQKFGHQAGTVVSISRTVLSAAELGAIDAVAGPLAQPKYRVTVALQSQSLFAQGKRHRLKAGMAIEADVLQDRRHLYEWVLEPLYDFRRKMR